MSHMTGVFKWYPTEHGCKMSTYGEEAFDGNKVFEKLRAEGCRRVIFKVEYLSKGVVFRHSPCAPYGLNTWIDKFWGRDLMVYQGSWFVLSDRQKPNPNQPFTVRPSSRGSSPFRLWCYEGTDYAQVQ